MSAALPRFGTDGWRGLIADDFTFDNVRRVAAAASAAFRRHGPSRLLLIGYDRRFLSRPFAECAARVFQSNGFQVRLASTPSPTPAVSVCVKNQGAAWGIVITASHNPALYNGFKIKDAHGRSAPLEITRAIEEYLASPPLPLPMAEDGRNDTQRRPAGRAARPGEAIPEFDFWPTYERYLRSRLDWPALRRWKASIVFDYLHGVGAGIAERLLRGAALKIFPLHAEADPLFGGLHPEPIEPYLAGLKKEVRSRRALAGVAVDGDADRLGMIDEQGRYLTPHQVFPLLVLHCIEHKQWRGKIVQSVSLGALAERIAQAYHLPFEEVPVGFKYIAERMLKEDILAGGEESGGYAVRGGLPERDGLLSGLLFLEMLAVRRKSPSRLLADMERRFGRARFKRVDFSLQKAILDKAAFAQQIAQSLPNRLLGRSIRDVRPGDGVKIVLNDGAWVLLRPSGTEPLLRTYAESDSWDRTEKLLRWARKVVESSSPKTLAGSPS